LCEVYAQVCCLVRVCVCGSSHHPPQLVGRHLVWSVRAGVFLMWNVRSGVFFCAKCMLRCGYVVRAMCVQVMEGLWLSHTYIHTYIWICIQTHAGHGRSRRQRGYKHHGRGAWEAGQSSGKSLFMICIFTRMYIVCTRCLRTWSK
jgi:hypothetical protein